MLKCTCRQSRACSIKDCSYQSFQLPSRFMHQVVALSRSAETFEGTWKCSAKDHESDWATGANGIVLGQSLGERDHQMTADPHSPPHVDRTNHNIPRIKNTRAISKQAGCMVYFTSELTPPLNLLTLVRNKVTKRNTVPHPWLISPGNPRSTMCASQTRIMPAPT